MSKAIILGTVGVGIAFFVNYVYATSADDDIFFRLSVSVLAGLYAGLLFLIFALPAISDWISRLVFSDPRDEADTVDGMREAKSLQGQGDYVGAVGTLRQIVTEDPKNRLAWGEMARVQLEHLDDAEGAVAMLTEALESSDWEDDDRAFFMLRIAEIQIENMENREEAERVLRLVCSEFPDSGHSANATHRLKELGAL